MLTQRTIDNAQRKVYSHLFQILNCAHVDVQDLS